MEELVREHTDESGVCSLPRQEVLEQVMGLGTKGRERGQGRVAKPSRSQITATDLERAREEMREEIAEMRQDFQSQVVQAVAEALRLYREGIQQIPPTQEMKVNMIITDYCMPGMTGYELLKKIKESSTMKKIPVIIMSSENLPTRINKCLQEGAEEFMLKPIQQSDVKKLRCYMTGFNETPSNRFCF